MRAFVRALPIAAFAVALTIVGPAAGPATAQNFRRGQAEFTSLRTVQVPSGSHTVAVVEFFHHGELADDGRNLAVSTRSERLVPSRVLQVGPGDFCRAAFQTAAAQSDYELLYGGEVPKGTELSPPWTAKEGLLLETRQWRDCDLNNLDSIRNAFAAAKRIGADYVDGVNHSDNPFLWEPGPFLSKYEGWLHIDKAAKYGFLTSSQDASFLLIDGKVIVSAPGRHGPMRHAQRGSRQDIDLRPGQYKFEYYHAAAGREAVMVAAWEIDPPDIKPVPRAIPPDVFKVQAVARATVGPLTMRTMKLAPDFLIKIDGDVPLPDNDQPLIKVSFKDISPRALSGGAKIEWSFGDGQTSDKPAPEHVYLKPGIYPVKLSFKRGSAKPVEIINRISVERPRLLLRDRDKAKAELPTLDDFLPILETYDPKTLDAAGLRQLAAAFEAKADELRAKYDEKLAAEKAAAAEAAPTEASDKPERPAPPTRAPRRVLPAAPAKKPPEDTLLAEANQWLRRAVDAGKTPFVGASAAAGDEELVKLAQHIAPLARNQLGDSKLAFAIWKGAADKVNVKDLAAECALDAAEIAINDLLDRQAGEELLKKAEQTLGSRRTGASGAKLRRVWGDLYAAKGDGPAARKAYLEADQLMTSHKRFIEQTAWRGAYSRSAEEFIKTGQLDRAAAELQAWQREFPGEKLDGYLTLLTMQYWAAREMYPQSVAAAEQLRTANPDSPYIDQVLMLAAEHELKQNNTAAAAAALHRIIKDYPGSPLVNEARELLEKVQAGGAARPSARPVQPPPQPRPNG